MGGAAGMFRTTCWFDVNKAKTHDKAQQKEIIGKLLRAYWKPVYCCLRRKGNDNEQAKDLTQGFFHEVVLGRDLIQQADQTKGRFRTFLLTALDHYVSNVYRRERAGKRSPAGHLVRLGEIDDPDRLEITAGETPDKAFHYTWASELLDEVLDKVEEDCASTGKTVHWQVFCAKILNPILDNAAPLTLKEICSKYGVKDESRASNMIVTVKRRFSAIMKRCLRQFVQSDSEVEEEFNDLLRILSGGGAG